MKNNKVVIFASISVVIILGLISFFIFQPSNVSINDNALYGKGYSLSLNKSWTHPEQIGSNDNPVGDFDLSEVYVKDNCFIMQDTLDLREDDTKRTDYTLSYELSYNNGVTVLNKIDKDSLIDIPVEGAEAIQFMKSHVEDYSYYLFNSTDYDFWTLVRGFSKERYAVIVRAGCTKSSGIDPATLLEEINLKPKN